MRYSLTHTEDFVSVFGISCSGMSDRYNISPTQDAPIIVAEGGSISCINARWGLVPSWKKDAECGEWLMNACSETLTEKSAFVDLVRHSRCIIPASGFYEWKKERGISHPFYFTLPSRPLFGLAGLYDWWTNPESGIPKATFTLITCPSNDLVGRIHNRMPVILNKEGVPLWLAGPYAPEVLQPYPDARMAVQQVSQMVNNSAYEGAECIQETGKCDWW